MRKQNTFAVKKDDDLPRLPHYRKLVRTCGAPPLNQAIEAMIHHLLLSWPHPFITIALN